MCVWYLCVLCMFFSYCDVTVRALEIKASNCDITIRKYFNHSTINMVFIQGNWFTCLWGQKKISEYLTLSAENLRRQNKNYFWLRELPISIWRGGALFTCESPPCLVIWSKSWGAILYEILMWHILIWHCWYVSDN